MSILRRFTNVVPRAVQRRTQILVSQEQAALAPVSAETNALLKQAEAPWSELTNETKVGEYLSDFLFCLPFPCQLPSKFHVYVGLPIVWNQRLRTPRVPICLNLGSLAVLATRQVGPAGVHARPPVSTAYLFCCFAVITRNKYI